MKKRETKRFRQKDKDAGVFNLKESQREIHEGDKIRKKNKMEAYKHYLAATEKCQENSEAHGRLAEIMIELKENIRAHQHLETAIHYAPKCAKYYFLKGKAFYNTGQWEEALNEFKRAVTENENEREPIFFYMIAKMQFKLGDYDNAILNYKEAEKMVLNLENSKIRFDSVSDASRMLADNHKYKIYLGRGKCYREKGDLENAKKDLTRAEELNKEDPEVQANVGLVYSKAGEYDKAKLHFLKAYEKASERAENCDNLGVACYHTHDLEDALKYFDKAIERDPARSISHYNRGLIFLEKRDFATAKECLDEAIRLEEDNEVYYHTKGHLYEMQGDPELYDYSIEQFQKAISINDKHVPSYFHLGKIYHLKHQLTDALMCFNKVMTFMTDNDEVYLERGRVLIDKGDPLHALSDFEKAVQLKPEKPEAYMYRGIAKLKLKKFEEAIEDFVQAESKSGEAVDPRVYDGLGCCYAELGQFLESKTNFNQAIELDRTNADFWNNRAQAYYKFERYDAAHADFNQALSLAPEDPVVYYSLGLCLFSMKKYKKSIDMLKMSLKKEQESFSEMKANTYYHIGIAYGRRNRFEKAIYPLSECIDLIPSRMNYVHERAKAYQMIGEDERAIQDFTEVIKKNPKNAHAYFRRAFSYKRLNKFEEAAKDFEKAKDLDPLNPALVVNYKMLDKVDVIVLCEPGEEKEY